MTDWQQPLIVALTKAEGVSIVHETVYENRFGFTDALIEMGADIVVHKEGLESITRRVPRRPLEQAAVITGPHQLHGADIEVPDLRGGFSHLIAALTAEGESTISNVGIISRGYEHFIDKLRSRRVPRRPLEQAAVITGPTLLHGADIEIPDLRGGFSHLIAALTADGESTISNVGIISRGYEHFIDKLANLRADFDFAGAGPGTTSTAWFAFHGGADRYLARARLTVPPLMNLLTTIPGA